MSDTPTLIEAGLGQYPVADWCGLLAPAGTSSTVIEKINQEFVKASRAPDLVKKLTDNGNVVASSTPQEMTKLVADDTRNMDQRSRASASRRSRRVLRLLGAGATAMPRLTGTLAGVSTDRSHSVMRLTLIAAAAGIVAAALSFAPATAQAKSVQDCSAEWSINKGALQAAGKIRRLFMAECRGLPPGRADRARAIVLGKGQFVSEAEAKSSCPLDTVVWINSLSRLFTRAPARAMARPRAALTCARKTLRRRLPRSRGRCRRISAEGDQRPSALIGRAALRLAIRRTSANLSHVAPLIGDRSCYARSDSSVPMTLVQ